ncbi:hypothetical protein HZ996_11155 [Cryomorphaceae bacterium]|nr:hypothetical protein HZ996_11155 [Cryomorphaceae bacterium]
MKAISTWIFLILVISVKAQIAIGGSVGYGGHQVFFDPSVKQTATAHTEFRVGLQYLNKKNSGVSLELAQTSLGWTLDSEDSTFSISWPQTELRFFSHFNIGKGVHRMPIQLGPFVGYASGDYPTNDKLRFGLSLGTGYALQTGKNIFQVMAHFRQELIPIYPVDVYLYSLPQSMTLSVGYYRLL